MIPGSRILIVNVNWLGDVLFSTPAIRALRKHRPDAFLACLVPPRCRELLERNPHLNEVITLPDDTSFLRSAGGTLAAAFALGRRRFDTAVFFHRSRTKMWAARAAGIRERLGFERPGGVAALLTRTVPLPKAPLHRLDLFLALLGGLGVPSDGRRIEFVPGEGAAAELETLLASCGVRSDEPYAVVHPGGNWDLKRWPAGHFARWIRLFRERFGWKVVLCGTAPERGVVEAIRAEAGEGAVSLCGRTSLGALALLLKRARFLLSNDSGPIHLAASQGARILTLFGPTSPELTGPVSEGRTLEIRKDVGCEVPCYFRSCDHRVCLDLVTPEEVLERTRELLA